MSKRALGHKKSFRVRIGDNAILVAIGENIQQSNTVQSKIEAVTENDIVLIRELFNQLYDKIKEKAPPQKVDAAVERVKEVEDEIANKKAKVSTFEYVKNWFSKNAPGLLSILVSVFIHPVVGKIVEATGEMAADEFIKFIQNA